MKKLIFLLWLLFAVPLCPTLLHATVAVNDARVTATGNGSATAYAYDFRILDQTHIAVYVAGTLRTLGTHYSVSGTGNANGGTITFVTAPAVGAQVLFLRNVPLSQLSTYIPNEAFPSTRIERDYDKLWMAIQQQQEILNRSLRIPITSDPLSLVPDAGKCIGWNDPATSLANLNCGGSGGGNSGGSAPGGTDGSLQYRVSSTTLGGIVGAITTGTGVTFSSGSLTATDSIFDTSFKITNAGSDRVVFGNPSQNAIQILGQGNSKTTALHLNPGTGTLPTGTIAEVVIGRTPGQAFGGNYGRWSFTNLGSANSNVSGIYGEYGGTAPQAPFIFNYAYESPANTFTSWEFWRAIADTTSVAEGAYAGSTLFGATDGTSRNKLVLSMPSIGAAGQRDSHALLWEGKANNGTERAVWWRQFIDVTSNVGASSFLWQQNLNGAGWTTKMALSDAGVPQFSGLTPSLSVCTDANKNLISCSGEGITGLTANFGVRATSATTIATSTLVRDDGTNLSFGDVSVKSLAFSYTNAPSGLSTVILPNSATPVIVGGIADPGADGQVVKYITQAGIQVRTAAGSSGGDMLLGTAQTVTASKIFGDSLLQATNPKITTGILDTNNNPLFSFVATASAVDGFQFTNAATANPSTIDLAAYGGSTNINVSVRPKGSGWFCPGGCPAGQAQGNLYLATLKLDGSTSGTITIQPQAVAGTYNFNMPTTAGTSGQVLTSAGGAGAPMTWATVTGTGTVTSVGMTYVGGIIALAGTSPITGAGTYALTVAGTSGGVPCFNSATTWQSSGIMAANVPMLGGGAGVCPTSGTRTGNTTEFATWTGTKTAGKQITLDGNGNFIISTFNVGEAAAAGDVTAAVAFGTTNRVIKSDGTGKGVKASGVTIDANDNITIPGTLALGGQTQNCDGTAGCLSFGQGTAPSALGTTSIQIIAPTSVTPYRMTLPGAAPAGDRLIQVNAAGVWSFVTVGTGVGDALTANPLSQFAATTSAQLAGVISNETGSGALVFGTAPTITGGTHTALTGLGIRSTGSGAFDMTIANTENLTAGRTLTVKLSDAARTLQLDGDVSVLNNGIIFRPQGTPSDITVPASGTMATLAGTQTFTNKTLTSPIIAKIGNLTSNGCVTTTGSDGTLGVGSCSAITGLSSDGTTLKYIYDGNSGGGVYPRGFLVDSVDATAHSGHLGCRRAHGTRGTPTALGTNDYGCALVSEIFDGVDYTMTGYFAWVVSGTPTASSKVGAGDGVVPSYATLATGTNIEIFRFEGVYDDYSKLSTRNATAMVFATGVSNTERMRVSSAGAVSIEALKTTGSAGSKKVVCVDTATGILYASSTGTDCSN